MIRPVAVLLAPLVSLGVLLGPWPDPVAASSPAPETAFASPTARPAAAQDIEVTLDALTPSVLPRSGRVTMRGTVTNTTSETLTDVNVHPLTSYSPMTSARDIEVSVDSDPESYLGERIITAGYFDSLDDLAPGETGSWRVRVPVSDLVISGEEGVYWIGVQVLAADETGVREIHGRARSFIPLMEGRHKTVPTSLILPVRRAVQRNEEGRLTRADEWAGELDPGGRLANLTAFVRSSGTAPVTWLIDPAVLDAVRELARGNPERSLEPTVPAPGEDDAEQQADEAEAQARRPRPTACPRRSRGCRTCSRSPRATLCWRCRTATSTSPLPRATHPGTTTRPARSPTRHSESSTSRAPPRWCRPAVCSTRPAWASHP